MSRLRKFNDACAAARRAAGYDDIVSPVRDLPLVSAGYENERTDIHGFSSYGWSRHDADTISVVLSCYCGHDLAVSADGQDPTAADWTAAEDEAFDLFVDHARKSVAVAA